MTNNEVTLNDLKLSERIQSLCVMRGIVLFMVFKRYRLLHIEFSILLFNQSLVQFGQNILNSNH